MKLVRVLTVFLGLLPLLATAAPEPDQIKEIRKALGVTGEEQITATPIKGLYQVVIGPHLFYVSEDGNYMLQGDLIDIAARRNLTTPARAEAQKAAVNAIGEENMVIYGPEDARHTVTVFTDIDCGYCRKLHNEMDKINGHGIQVRYLLYPRAGVNSASYDKAVSVWCAKDRNDALTRAKAGETPDKKSCDNPVKEHMNMGQMVGVRGTPTIMLDDGRMLPGYVPADRLAAMLAAPAP